MKLLLNTPLLLALVAVVSLVLIACSSPEPTSTPVPPTATPVPPTATTIPPTPTPVPPTATPEPTVVPAGLSIAEDADETDSADASDTYAACIQEHSDPERTDEILEAVNALGSGAEVTTEQMLDLLDAADTLAKCELLPAQVVPFLSQISREDATCIIENSGTAQLVTIFTSSNASEGQAFSLMSLAPLLGALQACDVSLDLTTAG